MSGWLIVVWGVQLLLYTILAGLGMRALRRARQIRTATDLPPVALVIALHGWTSWKQRCIESLLDQDYPGQLEVVLSFQDVQDPALAHARALGWQSRARVTVNPVSPGWTGAASNYAHGIEATDAEYLVLACDDTLADPHGVAALVTRLREGAVIVSAIPLVGQAESFPAVVSAVFYNALAIFGWAPGVTLGSGAAWGGLMAFRRSELDGAGGVDILRGKVAEDLALAQALAGGRRHAASLGPIVRSPIGAASWVEVWHRFRRLAVLAVHQSPQPRWVTLLALGVQYAYLALPAIALATGVREVWIGFGLLAGTRWGFLLLASRGAGLSLRAVWGALITDPLHVAALVAAMVNRGFWWGGTSYRLLNSGLQHAESRGPGDRSV